MSGHLRLWAIAEAEVQAIFGADPVLAERLRQVTTTRFPVQRPTAHRGGRLADKLGPLLRHPLGAPRIEPSLPGLPDAEALLSGRFIPPDRLPQSWALLATWLDELSLDHATWEVGTAQLDQIDYDLTRAGVASYLDLGHLGRGGITLALTPLPQLTFGLRSLDVVAQMVAAWQDHLAEVETGSAEHIEQILAFLSRYTDWRAAATTAGRPQPDLIASWRPA